MQKISKKKSLGVLLVLCMILAMIPAFGTVALAATDGYTIQTSDSTAVITNTVQSKLTSVSNLGGGTVTVTGNSASLSATSIITIPSGVTLVWKAKTQALGLEFAGGGTFELAAGGEMIFTENNRTAITADDGNVVISGGKISMTGDYNRAVNVEYGDVTVAGGEIGVTGSGACGIHVYVGAVNISGGSIAVAGSGCVAVNAFVGDVAVSGGNISANNTYSYGIFLTSKGSICVTGGTVKASDAGANKSTAYAIYIEDAIIPSMPAIAMLPFPHMAAAYLTGTCSGSFASATSAGIIVRSDVLNVPAAYEGTSTGLTLIDGSDTYKWGKTALGNTAIIFNDLVEIEWGSYVTPAAYNTSDMAAINAIIDNNGLNWTKANASQLSAGASVPSNWTGVTWSNDATKRITGLNVNAKGLVGVLNVSGLTALQTLYCTNNNLTGVNVTGLALSHLDVRYNYIAHTGYVTGFATIWDSVNFLFTPQNSGTPYYEGYNGSQVYYDSNGDAYYYNNSGVKTYLGYNAYYQGYNGNQIYYDSNGFAYYYDNNGAKTYLDYNSSYYYSYNGYNGSQIYYDSNGNAYFYDNYGTKTYFDYNNQYYNGYNGQVYYDNYGQPYYYDSYGNMVYYGYYNNYNGSQVYYDANGAPYIYDSNGLKIYLSDPYFNGGYYNGYPYYNGQRAVTYTASQKGGSVSSANTNGITLTFSEPVYNLAIGDITVTNNTGEVAVGTLTGNGTTWTIGVTNVFKQGNVIVNVANFGPYIVTTAPRTVNVYKSSQTATFTATQVGGLYGAMNTTAIKLTFSRSVPGLTRNAITVTNGTGEIVTGTLTGSGTTWTLSVSGVLKQGEVTVAVASFGSFSIDTPAQTVGVYKALGSFIDTPTGKPPIKNSNNSLTLPGGGVISTAKNVKITVPVNANIAENGAITFPKNSGGCIVTLPNGLSYVIGENAAVVLNDLLPLGYYVDINNLFIDVSENDWHYNAVMFVYAHGIMDAASISPMRFAPNEAITRATMVSTLYRMAGKPDVSYLPDAFSDVATTAWYADAVKWATANGVVNGYGNGKFGPEDLVTREQMVAILYRYCELKGVSVTAGNSVTLSEYVDAGNVSAYAAAAIKWACGAGIINGKPGGYLDPKGNITRAEIAAIFTRFLEII